LAMDFSLNWYKKAQNNTNPIVITFYNSYGELGVSFNGGKTYIYLNVNPYVYDKIKRLLRNKNYREVNKILKNISGKGKEEDNRKEILDELYERGILK